MKKTNVTIGVFGMLALGLLSSSVILGQGKKISKLEAENASLKNKNKILNEASDNEIIEEYHKKIDLLEAQLDSAKRVITTKENKITAINLEIDKLTEKISLKEDEIFCLKKQVDRLKYQLNAKPEEIVKEVTDLNSLNRIEELTNENKVLTTRCSSQNEKIRELKVQIIESTKKLKATQEELDGLKEQIKLTINSRNKEAELIKTANRTIERVNKKVKAGGVG